MIIDYALIYGKNIKFLVKYTIFVWFVFFMKVANMLHLNCTFIHLIDERSFMHRATKLSG